MVKKINQLSKFIPYVIILILAISLWFKGCNGKPQKFTNSELIKTKAKIYERKFTKLLKNKL